MTQTEYRANIGRQTERSTEHQLQSAIVAYLDLVLPPDIRVVGVSNNPRSKATGGKEKARGLKKGLPDLILVGRISGFLEVKRRGAKLTPDQVEWERWCLMTGRVPHAVVRSLEDARDVVQSWGVILKEHTI
jgi:VRR-NUC domain